MNYYLAGWIMILMLSVGVVSAHSDDVLAEAKELIDAETDCSQLDEDQLEHIGEYFMEQMHPGESHTLMDQMMGGEGSKQLRDMHIMMAQRLYCNDASAANSGMMGSDMMKQGMMGSGMDMMDKSEMHTSYKNSQYSVITNLTRIAVLVALIIGIVWIIQNITRTPLRTLNARYARGELTKKQYEEVRRGLKK